MSKGLVIKNDGIGDLVVASGLISFISKQFTEGVDLVVCRRSAEVAARIPGNINVILVNIDGIRYRKRLLEKGIPVVVATPDDQKQLDLISSTQYRMAICLRRFIRSSTVVIMRRVKAEQKFCAWQYPTNISWKSTLRLTKGWNHYSGDERQIHELDYLTSFVSEIFGQAVEESPDLNSVELSKRGVDPTQVGLCIGGAARSWPLEYWLVFAKVLLRQGYELSLFGGADDVELAQDIVKELPEVRNYTGNISFMDAVEVLQKLSILVGNDTGFTHFASLVVPKIIVLVGGGTYRRFFPWPDTTNQWVVSYEMSCYDCTWLCPFPSKFCILLIKPLELLSLFQAVVGGQTSPGLHSLGRTSDKYHLSYNHREKPPLSERFQSNEFKIIPSAAENVSDTVSPWSEK